MSKNDVKTYQKNEDEQKSDTGTLIYHDNLLMEKIKRKRQLLFYSFFGGDF